MKARFSPTTAKESLSEAQKAAAMIYVEGLWEQKQKTISNRYLLAMCLALNDLYHFGDKRLSFVIQGIEDILKAYAEDSFTPKEARHGSIDDDDFDPMAEAMMRELASRPKLHIDVSEHINSNAEK